MAYKALYRAYRPTTFDEVCGQSAVVKTLKNAILHDKVGHAYLFCGPRGTGKTSMAKIFATALNCKHEMTVNPCLECENCKTIIQGSNPDVLEIDAASNNGADDIRQLRDSVKFLPATCRKKVYIIDEVHMLTQQAFNALLKTLEEPPSYVVFILATTEPYKIPNTILSRVQRFDFEALDEKTIASRLEYVAKEENLKITTEAINLIASYSEGGMRDALSMLDQVISYSTNEEITSDDVLAVSGNTSSEDLFLVVKNCYENNSIAAIESLNKIIQKGKEIPKICNDLINFLKEILLYKAKILKNYKGIFNDQNYTDTFDKISTLSIYKWLDILNETNNNMKFSNQKKSYLDLALLKISDISYNMENKLLEKIDQLEREINSLKFKAKNDEISFASNQVKSEEIIELVSKQNEEETKNDILDETIVKSNNDYIQIEEVNDILNNGDKELKKLFNDRLRSLAYEFEQSAALEMISYGQVVAANSKSLIIVLLDTQFCNRVMNYNYYYELLEIFKTVIPTLENFYAIPQNCFNKILKDFKQKLEVTGLPVKLDYIEIPVLLPNEKDKKVVTLDSTIVNLKEIFGDILKVKEK